MKTAAWAVALLASLSFAGQLLWPLEFPGRPVDVPPLPSPAPLLPEPGSALPTREEPVVVDAPGGRLPGLVVEPVAAAPDRPALVLVAGGGPARAADLAGLAHSLAAQGLAVLVHDKRTSGYSPVHRDYAALAADSLAALAVLRARPGVAADRVGLLGISEGGWVVAIAAGPAAGPAGPAFVVQAGGPTVSPGEQAQWLLDSGLARQGAPLGARAALAAAQATSLPGLLAYTRHDPEPALGALRVPLLAVYGTRDTAIPVVDSARRLLAATGPAAGVWVLEGADHGLAGPDGRQAPGFAPAVAAWVRGLPDTAVPPPGATVRGAVATQEFPALPQPADPLGGGALVLAGTAVVLAGTLAGPLAGPLAGLATRRDRRPPDARWAPVRRRSRLLGSGAVGGVVTINAGLAALAGVSVLGGGPVAAAGVWVLMRGSGVLVAVATVGAALAGSAALTSGARPTPAQRIGWLGSLVAGAASLALATRAGLFAPRW